MSTVTIAEAREHLDELCASVAETGEPVIIERGGRTFMLVPGQEDEEVERRRKLLFDSPENARRLRAALARTEGEDAINLSIAELRDAVK
jgi:PHD/YefM family antitoxin component YafN of YafNO toxin-antitoxin module